MVQIRATKSVWWFDLYNNRVRLCPQGTQAELLKAKVHKQLASQYLNELAEKITKKCFDKCYIAGTSGLK